MHAFLTILAQQGQQPFFHAVRQNWGNDSVIPVHWLAAAAGLLLALLAGIAARHRWRMRGKRSRPTLLFHQLAQKSGLSLADQWLLLRIARAEALPNALTLLLSPATLHHHGRAYAHRRPRGKALVVLKQVRRLRRQLFDEP